MNYIIVCSFVRLFLMWHACLYVGVRLCLCVGVEGWITRCWLKARRVAPLCTVCLCVGVEGWLTRCWLKARRVAPLCTVCLCVGVEGWLTRCWLKARQVAPLCTATPPSDIPRLCCLSSLTMTSSLLAAKVHYHWLYTGIKSFKECSAKILY